MLYSDKSTFLSDVSDELKLISDVLCRDLSEIGNDIRFDKRIDMLLFILRYSRFQKSDSLREFAHNLSSQVYVMMDDGEKSIRSNDDLIRAGRFFEFLWANDYLSKDEYISKSIEKRLIDVSLHNRHIDLRMALNLGWYFICRLSSREEDLCNQLTLKEVLTRIIDRIDSQVHLSYWSCISFISHPVCFSTYKQKSYNLLLFSLNSVKSQLQESMYFSLSNGPSLDQIVCFLQARGHLTDKYLLEQCFEIQKLLPITKIYPFMDRDKSFGNAANYYIIHYLRLYEILKSGQYLDLAYKWVKYDFSGDVQCHSIVSHYESLIERGLVLLNILCYNMDKVSKPYPYFNL